MSAKLDSLKNEGPKSSEITIELFGPKNNDVHFHPLNKTLRGRAIAANLPEGQPYIEGAPVRRMPDIPGLYVAVNIEQRYGRVYDMLALDQVKMRAVSLWCEQMGYGKQVAVDPIATHLNQDEIATWLYWMKRLVDAGLARLVDGSTFPDEKHWPKGRTRMEFNNPNWYLPKFADQFEHAHPTGAVGVEKNQVDPFSPATLGKAQIGN